MASSSTATTLVESQLQFSNVQSILRDGASPLDRFERGINDSLKATTGNGVLLARRGEAGAVSSVRRTSV